MEIGLKRAALTRNHLVFYDTNGLQVTSIGQNFNVGDSLGFDDGYVITKNQIKMFWISMEILV